MEQSHKSRRQLKFLFAMIVAVVCLPSKALHAWSIDDEAGLIAFEEFGPAQHGGGPYSLQATEDSKGNIYICNEAGVLLYNGHSWIRLPEIPSSSTGTVSIEIDDQDRIWVGGVDKLGYYDSDRSGRLVFFDYTARLLEALDGDELGLIWDIYSHEGKQYFITSFHVVIREGDRWTVEFFDVSRRILPTWLDNTLYVHARGDGLYRFKGKRAEKILPDREEISSGIISVLPSNEGQLRLATVRNGIWSFDGDRIQQESENPAPSEFSLAHVVLKNGNILIGQSNGLFLLDQKKSLKKINEGKIRFANRLFEASDGSIWITTPENVSRIPPPRRTEFRISASKIERYDDTLYLGSEGGIQKLRNGQSTSHAVGWTSPALTRGEFLVYADGNALKALRGGEVFSQIKLDRPIFHLNESVYDSEVFYTSDEPEMSKWRINEDGIQLVARTIDSKKIIASIAEVDRQTVLYTTFNREIGLIRWSQENASNRAPSFELISSDTINPNRFKYILAIQFGDTALLATDQGVHTFNWEDKSLSKVHALSGNFGRSISDFVYHRLKGDTSSVVVWINNKDHPTGRRLGFLRHDGNDYIWEPIQLTGLSKSGPVRDILYEERNEREILWVSTSEQLFRYDITGATSPPRLKTNLTSIRETVAEQTIFGGFGPLPESDSLPYPQKSLRIDFASPPAEVESIGFETRLIGFTEDWSQPSEYNFREFSNLSEGDYRFEVRAIDEFGRAGPETAFEFRILPPWYRTKQAIASYIAFSALIFGVGLRWWTLHLRRRNLELETLINQRTSDLEFANQELRKANSVKQDFLASMSHEIRNPLNGILGIAKILEEDGSTKERIGYLNACARHLHQLLGQVLDYSSLEAGKLTVQSTPFDALALSRDAVDMHRIMAEEKGLQLLADFGDIDKQWVGDPVLVKQIIVNLISNGIKYTTSGHVRFNLETEIEGESVHAKFSVEDSGPGIPEDQRENIFLNFTRLKHLSYSQISGTGLGLSIASELARKMDGELSLDNSYTEGARFVLSLKFGLTTIPASQREPIASSDLGNLLRGKKVLVADDMDFNRYICREFFEELGANVSEAFDGDQTLDALQSNSFDLAVLDINMPKQSGTQAVHNFLRTNPAKKPLFIALSAHVAGPIKQEALDAGFTSFVEKPLDSDKLTEALEAQSSSLRVTMGGDLLSYLKQGSPERAEKLEARFNASLRVSISELDKNITEGETQQARESLHKLKGLVNLRRKSEITEILASLSETIGTENDVERGRELCQRLRDLTVTEL